MSTTIFQELLMRVRQEKADKIKHFILKGAKIPPASTDGNEESEVDMQGKARRADTAAETNASGNSNEDSIGNAKPEVRVADTVAEIIAVVVAKDTPVVVITDTNTENLESKKSAENTVVDQEKTQTMQQTTNVPSAVRDTKDTKDTTEEDIRINSIPGIADNPYLKSALEKSHLLADAYTLCSTIYEEKKLKEVLTLLSVDEKNALALYLLKNITKSGVCSSEHEFVPNSTDNKYKEVEDCIFLQDKNFHIFYDTVTLKWKSGETDNGCVKISEGEYTNTMASLIITCVAQISSTISIEQPSQ